MHSEQPNNPLHGVKLEQMVTRLQACYGWDGLAARIPVNCFKSEPSIKSSLKFLRKTPWAREKVEHLYLATFSTTAARAETDRSGSEKQARRKPSATASRGAKPAPHPDPWKKHRR